jgi:hypothetical protein
LKTQICSQWLQIGRRESRFVRRARAFAKRLEIRVDEEFALDESPCIKCNVSTSTNKQIYHLPFDQMYDATVVHLERGEFYARTVEEAEAAGFRRAFRWHGSGED